MDNENAKDDLTGHARESCAPYMDLSEVDIPIETARSLPAYIAKKYKLIPISVDEKKIVVAMANPLNIFAVDDIRMFTGLDVKPVLADEEHIMAALDKHGIVGDEEYLTHGDSTTALMNAIVMQAIERHADLIHVEPMEDIVRVIFRVDGVMSDVMATPKRIQEELIERLKKLAGLNADECVAQQNGRIALRVYGKLYDFRVSTKPGRHGENIEIQIKEKGE